MHFRHPAVAALLALAAVNQQQEAPARHHVGAGGQWDAITGAYVPHYAGAYIPRFTGWDSITGADGGVAAAAAQAAATLGPSHPTTLALHSLAARQMQSFAPMQQLPNGNAPGGAPASIAYGGSLGVETRTGNKPRLYPLGFTSTGTVAASTAATITSRPQILFRGERLVVPSSVATNFVINDIRVGKNSQLVQSTALPASAFVETMVDGRMTLDTAQIGSDITLSVTNTDGAAAHAFSAVIFGAAIDV